jgi:hypothetical protein
LTGKTPGADGHFRWNWLIVVKAERNSALYVGVLNRTGRRTQEFPMKINWLGTTAVALLIGTGAVIAQTPPDVPQKRDEGPRAQTPSVQTPSRDAERPAAGEQRPADRMKDRTTQSEPKAGARELQRGEGASPPDRRQAEEPQQPHDAKQPSRQSQDQPNRDERSPAGQTRQSQDEQKGRDAKQPTKQSQDQPSRDERSPAGQTRQSQDEQRGRDARQPADAKQQQGQQQQLPGRDRNNQAGQPPGSPTAQQGMRPDETNRDRQQGQITGQTGDSSTRRDGRSSVSVNEDQRRQILERLQRDRTAVNENVDVRVNVGERLPPRVRPRPLPPDIVRIAPQYRDYEYTVIDDRIAIVDPRTREVVDIIDEGGGPSYGRTTRYEQRDRVVLAGEQREMLKRAVRRTTTVGSSSSSGSLQDSSCLTLQPVPEELTRSNPELSQYRILAIGDQAVLVDPRQQKIVEVID